MNLFPFSANHQLTSAIIFACLLIMYHNEMIYSPAYHNKWRVYNADVLC